MKGEDLAKILDFMSIAGKLKETYRFSENPILKNKESAADHSWRLSLMVIAFSDNTIDKEKALKIAIVHDLAESITGDVDYRLIKANKVSKGEKKKNETKAMKKILKSLTTGLGTEIYSLWKEYEEAKTLEARFVKALDKLETLAYLSEKGKKAIDDKQMILTYADKYVDDFPKLKPVLEEIKNKLNSLMN